ncbi:unnamed protein product [Caenorhabditis bovis]|uniref:DUF1248 domain-containing protein n=1 Tax=Caenorhabditis bovis TaxID=2654633 RepID=A0A8S1EXL5_9PELO|nr:unnamed protein product [Caenorhabditis bovis]
MSAARVMLTPNDVVIHRNPSERLIKNFCETISQYRKDFHEEDIKLLQNTMGDKYNLYLLCLKDSDDVIASSHVINYESIATEKGFQTWGLAWHLSKYHANGILTHLIHQMSEELSASTLNVGGCAQPESAAIWRKFLYTRVRGCTYFVSSYKPNELANPDIDYEKYRIKDVTEIPASDLINYDQTIFPYQRAKMMETLLKNGISKIAYDEKGNVVGMGCLTTYKSGMATLGPLYCDNSIIAQAIFQNIVKDIPKGSVETIQIRCSDKFQESATWIRPFLRKKQEMTMHSHVKFNRGIPVGLNFTKAYVNSNPDNAPL